MNTDRFVKIAKYSLKLGVAVAGVSAFVYGARRYGPFVKAYVMSKVSPILTPDLTDATDQNQPGQ